MFKTTKYSLVAFMMMIAPAFWANVAQAADYAVIIHSDNKIDLAGNAAREIIKQLYLKELTQWPNGLAAEPFGRESGSAVQLAFEKQVLGLSGSESSNHWARMKQTKGETPPREVGPDRILFRLVSKFPGGFAVVTAEEMANAPSSVMVLYNFSD
ncbi:MULTISPECIES: hypothetical protein [unclassified Iodidimonas]|jgi:hypothetical protein|uniref:hypothetical protein n=1 Tax=unclassified Iodidimonas TaxID=2626145 RepID=UPI002482C35F|nr:MULTISPECIES: hypothetical protein [unclassified Iodidimonas]